MLTPDESAEVSSLVNHEDTTERPEGSNPPGNLTNRVQLTGALGGRNCYLFWESLSQSVSSLTCVCAVPVASASLQPDSCQAIHLRASKTCLTRHAGHTGALSKEGQTKVNKSAMRGKGWEEVIEGV